MWGGLLRTLGRARGSEGTVAWGWGGPWPYLSHVHLLFSWVLSSYRVLWNLELEAGKAPRPVPIRGQPALAGEGGLLEGPSALNRMRESDAGIGNAPQGSVAIGRG